MSERQLRLAPEAAKGRLARAAMAEFDAAHEAMLAAQRVLAAELGEPYAVPLESPVQWDIGAPLPHLIQNDSQPFLLFWLRDTEYDFYAAVANPGEHLATVEFKGCVSAKMGAPNDEVFPQPSTARKGACRIPSIACAEFDMDQIARGH